MDFIKTIYSISLISRNIVLAFTVLVPLASTQQGVLEQVCCPLSARVERPAEACLLITLADSNLSRPSQVDPNIPKVAIVTPDLSNVIETTHKQGVSKYPLRLDSNNNSSCSRPKSSESQDAKITLNSWYYYFSSLAQTIAAGSALLVALAVIRIQALDNKLDSIVDKVAKAFNDIGKQDDYHSEALPHFLNEKWTDYFETVESLINKYEKSFKEDSYTKSKYFIESLIAQGHKYEARNRQLHRALALAFIGTVIFAGAAILVLPAAQWISPMILWFSWAISGVSLVILFVLYLRLVLGSVKSK